MKYFDISLLQNYDLNITNGDFVISESSQQEANLIINTALGNWFEYPLVGVGITNYLASSITALALQNIIKIQMQNDGFIVQSVSVQGSTIDSLQIQLQAFRP
jgi:hypothetical protein